MNKHRLWLLVIIIIAFALRLTLLGEQSLWYDEGVTWLLAQMSLPELIQWTAADIQPPFYYLLLWLTSRIFGASEWALRFPSALFNTLTLPLIYILARRLFTRKQSGKHSGAPALALLLLALSPLMTYYSQEARMYTLLVFEATLASYLLLKILHRPTPYSLLPTPYSLIATAALYTHYFAAFLLIAHALYVILILWQRRWPKTLIAQSLQMFGLTVLLFAPWLSILLSRLGDDPSYWPGALKLNESLRKVLISFTAGETIFEQTGWRLALGYVTVLILGGLWGLINKQVNKSANEQTSNNILTFRSPFTTHRSLLTVQSFRSKTSSFFFLLWLLIPPALILILSYQSPKFNPRYTMLSYPAFVLLLAATLNRFLQIRRTKYALRFMFYASRLLFTLSLLFILAASLFSLYNWFTGRDFEKDDFQALAQFVREREAPAETVLLSSGHMFPVWAYYYGWDNWTPLPPMERLDIHQVTDLSIADNIAQAVAGKDGVWLVSWQDEVIDPNRIVPFWLDLIGRRPLDAGDFQGVGLEHWRLDQAKISLLHGTPIKQPVPESGHNFANRINLLGMTQLSENEIALFWRPRQTLPDDLLYTLDLTDKAGFDWDQVTATGRPGAYFYPPSRWPVGQMVMTRHLLPWQTGTPPGVYTVEIGLGQIEPETEAFNGWDILDQQGRPQRRTALLASITLAHSVQTEESLPPPNEPLIDLSPVVVVQRSAVLPQTAEPGDRVLLALVWQAGSENQSDRTIAFDLLDAANQTFSLGAYAAPSRDYDLSHWQPGEVVLGQYWLDIPPDTAPGPATIHLHMIDPANGIEHISPITSLEILPTERNFTPPESVNLPLKANFSGQTTLLGANCSPWTGTDCRAVPGESITLTFYWQANAPFDKNYTIFTHLLGPDETIIVNTDHAPAKNTQGWITGEIIADAVTLNIPADLPPGNYAIEIGLYDAADPAFQRLPLTTGDTRVILSQPLTVE